MKAKTRDGLRASRDLAGRRALDALDALRGSITDAEAEIRRALADEPARRDFFVPNRQYLGEVVEYGAAFGALWFADGWAETNEEEDR